MTDHDAPFDLDAVRADFPVLHQQVHGRPLVYLDNAASAQMPKPVLDRMIAYQTQEHANVHRGVHTLSQRATEAFEAARATLRDFIHAAHDHEIIFTRGTTEAINLVAHSFAKAFLEPGDELIVSAMEHHSNIVPWQMACADRGASLKVIPMTRDGQLVMSAYRDLLTPKTKLVAVGHVSNALGTVHPVEDIIRLAHARDIPVLLDGAQAVPHMRVDVQALDCDFYAFSSHKLGGPTGVGVLYGKTRWLDAMPPYQGGGDMIRSVTFDKTEYNTLPHKFEAGTPAIAQAVGLGAAAQHLMDLGLDRVAAWEAELLAYATEQLSSIDGLRIVGTAPHKAAVVSFVIDGIHPHDIGTILDHEGVAVRAGHHCAQPIMDFLDIPATSRASFAYYNTKAEVDALVRALHLVKELFGP